MPNATKPMVNILSDTDMASITLFQLRTIPIHTIRAMQPQIKGTV